MLTSCCRVLLNRIARQPATFLSHFSAHQRFVRTFYLSATTTSEFSKMSADGEWTSVEKSGKSSSKKKGKGSQKGNEQKPKSANGTTPKGAKGGSATPTKEASVEPRKESETSEPGEDLPPWLSISQEEPEAPPKPSPQNTPNESQKKKNKKKKNKNKDKAEQERDPATPKVESAEPKSPSLTNGMKSDSDERAEPKTTETTAAEPKRGTKASTTEAPTPETKDTNKQDDNEAPMSWEDNAEDTPPAETRDANKPDDDGVGPMSLESTQTDETESQSAADGEESAVSQTSGHTTDKDIKSTEESAVESSPEKKTTDSGAKSKVVMHWKKSKDRSKAQPGDGNSSRDQKQDESSSKKPKTESTDRRPQSKEKQREGPRDKRSSSKDKGRDGSRSRGKAEGRKTRWDEPQNQHSKNSTGWENARGDGKRGRGRKGGHGAAGGDETQEDQWSRSEPLPIVGFDFQEIKGDLFQCKDDDAMAHCVSEDLEMGKGIAVLFKESFGRVGKLRAQEKKIGEVAVLQIGKSYVYYLITKERYFHKPTYDALRASLLAMRTHCLENGVTSVAMPQIGCGLDKLNWGVVMEIIKEVFNNTNMTIKIYYYSG